MHPGSARRVHSSQEVRLAALLLAGLLLCCSLAYATEGVERGAIIVGQSITLQDGKNEYGAAVLSGVQAYLEAANRHGGVHGRKVVLKTLDDSNSSEQASANARRLIEQEKVFLVFGSIEGGPSNAVMKVAVNAGVPFFGPMAGSPTLRTPHQPLVFPVRVGHRKEFRALLDYARKTGSTRVAFVRSDSEVGLLHLENVKIACNELGMELVADLPFKPDISEAQIEAMAQRIGATRAHVVINHGSPGMYERLIRKARAQGIRVSFSAVNSGSTQLAAHLGELAHGMLFAQVVPSPWEGKSAITREYQREFARRKPGQAFSYGSLEGYLTAKALVRALRLAGPDLTREGFVRALYEAGGLELAEGVRAVYRPGEHIGLSLVDLAIVTREGKFLH